ncbi:MAG TPA: hypothetical protein VEQ62_18230 [Stellaceae bacterium]|jgi:hypothetical protein|nr:hypothetical protein [Stellaceae bacterium]
MTPQEKAQRVADSLGIKMYVATDGQVTQFPSPGAERFDPPARANTDAFGRTAGAATTADASGEDPAQM